MAKRAGLFARKCLAAASIAGTQFCASPAHATERVFDAFSYLSTPHLHRKTDFFGGIDLANAVTFAWAGVTYAPVGTLSADGWRLRIMGGAGRYTYLSSIVPGGVNDASVYTAELLGGYRRTFDDIFGRRVHVGAFAGVNYESQMLALPDPFNPTQGSKAGIKAAIEIYSRIAQAYILTAIATASTAHSKYYAKTALLYELTPRWSFGGELVTMGDARYSEHRAGLAGSLTWGNRILTLSAGALDNSGRGSGAYATLSVYSPF
jgi:hypothetical protein